MIQKTNSLAVINPKPKALELMASRLSMEPQKVLETLKATVFSKASNEEVAALVVVSNEYGLNPFLKEIYAFPAKGGGIVPVISIDGWNKMMIRHPQFDGIEFEFADDDKGGCYSCTATIYIKDRSKPVKITEYMDECFRETDPWKKCPRRMLRHKALIQGARVAFGFSGAHDEDEAIDISATVTTVEPVKVLKPSRQEPTQDVHAEFQAFLDSNGFNFNHLQAFCDATGAIENASSISQLSEIPAETLTRLLRAKTGLIQGLEMAKGGAK